MRFASSLVGAGKVAKLEWVESRFEEFAAVPYCCCLHRLVRMCECCRLFVLVSRLQFGLVGRFCFRFQRVFERMLRFVSLLQNAGNEKGKCQV